MRKRVSPPSPPNPNLNITMRKQINPKWQTYKITDKNKCVKFKKRKKIYKVEDTRDTMTKCNTIS